MEETKTKAKREKQPVVKHACICGCGGETGSNFVPGHDSKVKSAIIKEIDRATKANETPNVDAVTTPEVRAKLAELFGGKYAEYATVGA